MPTPHDALFKHTFSDPVNAAAILKTALPTELARRIDWTSLEPLPTHFIDEELRALEADLLFRMVLDGHVGRMLLLFEHQSRSDNWMPLRLLDHILHIWKEHRREHPDSKLLPAVLSVVLHHSERGWTAAVELIDLMDLSPELKHILGPHLPNFRFILDDLTHQTDEAIRQRVQQDVVKLALLLLKNLRHDADLTKLKSFTSLMAEVEAAPSGVAALKAAIRYILTVTKADVTTLTHLFTTQISPEAGAPS